MKVGVIGTGSMGEKHVRAYSALSNYCHLIGIYDNNKTRAKEISNKYEVTLFESITELLKVVDIVSIVVPTEYHYEIGLLCIKYNVHMLIEKPITNNVNEANELIQKAKEKGLKIQVGHIELYNPLINILKHMLVNEKVIAFDVHRMSPYDQRLETVDVVQDLMIHDIYILKELATSEISNLCALGQIINNTPKHASAIIKFRDGSVAHLTASFKSVKKIRTIRVFTEKSIISANLLNGHIEVIKTVEGYKDFQNNNADIQRTEIIEVPYIDSLKLQLGDFINSVKNDTPLTVKGEDGVNALAICNRISSYIKESEKSLKNKNSKQ
ncbi:Gfo/Idh/MocA family oxidoreductase [Priestia aryabhattai]|uniref:Gfo/Idh/MocA family protein n=1 Tax=Priestia aryabhattai TaxID=412384 RepID=UPI0039822BBE